MSLYVYILHNIYNFSLYAILMQFIFFYNYCQPVYFLYIIRFDITLYLYNIHTLTIYFLKLSYVEPT